MSYPEGNMLDETEEHPAHSSEFEGSYHAEFYDGEEFTEELQWARNVALIDLEQGQRRQHPLTLALIQPIDPLATSRQIGEIGHIIHKRIGPSKFILGQTLANEFGVILPNMGLLSSLRWTKRVLSDIPEPVAIGVATLQTTKRQTENSTTFLNASREAVLRAFRIGEAEGKSAIVALLRGNQRLSLPPDLQGVVTSEHR